MKTTRHTRTLTAWTLYASVLFSLLLCGLHHGQMGGLRLAGLEGGFCSVNSEHGVAIDLDGAGGDQHMAQLDCPVCSSFGLAVPLSSGGWSFTPAQAVATSPIVVRSWAQPPPRYQRPALNPRASPAAFPAAVFHFA
ncbi:TPA: DUF2946 domain-containing protein [Pseudomonas putida]|uniref:DUF2946 family protein n=1 Tax=Pseudomonas putida TaxID=303 RepID=A0AAQ1YBI6_PSEPU|nr:MULTISPECIES: DUF2946 family protein [Pseudomonas]MDD1991693.1 DUF2946 domain-containing protein [Pseudomonas putida]QJQ09850.1 DUF2946 family protein [Pseudomonas putida]TCP79343.1 DUF2946 family protein [Pseudomonas putida]HDS0917477.1 DUF2946 domain-containing protein [Pseudomonas putida]HDS0935326.1 DUF2946 domain-containing protein [Pseudomonas putida]